MINWLRSLNGIDIILIVFVVLVVWLVTMLIHEAHMDTTATCDYFVNYDAAKVPARCLEYWTNGQ